MPTISSGEPGKRFTKDAALFPEYRIILLCGVRGNCGPRLRRRAGTAKS